MNAQTDNRRFKPWNAPLSIWAAFGVVWFAVALPMRFHVGVLVMFIELGWMLFGVAAAIILLFVRGPRTQKILASLLVVTVIGGVILISPTLERMTDRVVFEIQRPKYESAIEKLKAGETPETACSEFRFGCGVSRVDGFRVAFYHPEFFDKYIGYVYDPSGVYSTIHELAEQDYETYREEYWGELVPGIVMFCRSVKIPFYRCFFS